MVKRNAPKSSKCQSSSQKSLSSTKSIQVKEVAAGINSTFVRSKPGVLMITHYQRILTYVTPHHVHIMLDGKIIKSGGKELAAELEDSGYQSLK